MSRREWLPLAVLAVAPALSGACTATTDSATWADSGATQMDSGAGGDAASGSGSGSGMDSGMSSGMDSAPRSDSGIDAPAGDAALACSLDGGRGSSPVVVCSAGDGAAPSGVLFQPATVVHAFPKDDLAALVVNDFNGDGHPDVLLSLYGLTVYLGDGRGGFAAPVQSPLSKGSIAPSTVGDFDGDGKLDLVGASYTGRCTPTNVGDLVLYLGNGDGTFREGPETVYAGACYASSFGVADFNGDGRDDLAIGGYAGVSVMLSTGGGFVTTSSIPDLSAPVAADFDGDGLPDLAASVIQRDAEGYVTVRSGRGDGTFAPALKFAAPADQLVAADLNEDGIADLVCNGYRPSAAVILGGCHGLSGPLAIPASGGSIVSVSDLDGDGTADLLFGDGPLAVLLGGGNGSFSATTTGAVPTGRYQSTATADFNGDGLPDLVGLTAAYPNQLVLRLNAGCGSVAALSSRCGTCAGTCVEGGCLESIRTPEKAVVSAPALAAEGATVYGVSDESGDVWQIAPTGDPTLVASGLRAPGAIAVDASYAYVADGYAEPTARVVRVPLAGGATSTIAATTRGPIEALAVDATNVYFTVGRYPEAGFVEQADLGGGKPLVLASSAQTPVAIAVNAASVFWATQGDPEGDGTIVRAPIGGGALVTLASGQLAPTSIALDAESVYWANAGGAVMKEPLEGGPATQLFAGPAFGALALDADHLYFTTDSDVWWIPLAGGAARALTSGLADELSNRGSAPRTLAVTPSEVYWTWAHGIMRLRLN